MNKIYRFYRQHVLMYSDATDAVLMNTGLNSVLVFILLLRQIIKAICRMKSSRHFVVLRKKQAS